MDFAGLGGEFERQLLKAVMVDVRKVTTVEQRKGVETYHFMRDHWEFHGPDGFYWNGSAETGWGARYHGWTAWLKQNHPSMVE